MYLKYKYVNLYRYFLIDYCWNYLRITSLGSCRDWTQICNKYNPRRRIHFIRLHFRHCVKSHFPFGHLYLSIQWSLRWLRLADLGNREWQILFYKSHHSFAFVDICVLLYLRNNVFHRWRRWSVRHFGLQGLQIWCILRKSLRTPSSSCCKKLLYILFLDVYFMINFIRFSGVVLFEWFVVHF